MYRMRGLKPESQTWYEGECVDFPDLRLVDRLGGLRKPRHGRINLLGVIFIIIEIPRTWHAYCPLYTMTRQENLREASGSFDYPAMLYVSSTDAFEVESSADEDRRDSRVGPPLSLAKRS